MPSFDIVSKTDLQEVDNAINNVTREIGTRFDFKGSNAKVERTDSTLTINADDDMKLRQMHELLKGHITRRGVDAGVLEFKDPEQSAGQAVRQTVIVREGIDRDMARKITKSVKDAKIKVQIAVQGDELRVTGKKRDDLQAVIAHVKGMTLEMPVQFVNMRD